MLITFISTVSQRWWNTMSLLCGPHCWRSICSNSQRSEQYTCSAGNSMMQNSQFSYPTVAVSTTSTHYTCPDGGGQAELARVAGLNTKMAYLWTVTDPDTNWTWCRATILIETAMLALPLNHQCHDSFSPVWALLQGCKNRALSVSWPEVVKAIPNQDVDCFVS